MAENTNEKLIVEFADNGTIFRGPDLVLVEKTPEDAITTFGLLLCFGFLDKFRLQELQDTFEVKIFDKKTGEELKKKQK